MNSITPKTVFYHGNENKEHRFSELRPTFFTTDKEYAKGYGDYVYPYKIRAKKIFDTSTDEQAREYYNNVFLKDVLGKDAKRIEKGQKLSFVDADNFWAFIVVEEEMGNGLGYDSMLVCEGTEEHFNTSVSIVPFSIKQIVPLKRDLEPSFNL